VNIQAQATYFQNQQLIPEDRVQEIFQTLYGLKISTARKTRMEHHGCYPPSHDRQSTHRGLIFSSPPPLRVGPPAMGAEILSSR
jgi:hypothetical protein